MKFGWTCPICDKYRKESITPRHCEQGMMIYLSCGHRFIIVGRVTVISHQKIPSRKAVNIQWQPVEPQPDPST